MVTVRKKAGPKQVGRPPGAAGDALLLDRFSRIDLETWRQLSESSEAYNVGLLIGRLLIEAGFEGILYPSSKGKGLCIAMFPEVLINSESYVELSDPAPAHLGHRRLDSTTCQALLEPGD